MTGTPSRTARVSIARWNPKEAEGKLPVRGTRTAYEATTRWARGPIDSKPDVIRSGVGVYAADVWEESHASYPERSAGCAARLGASQGASRHWAEVSRGHSSHALTVRSMGTLARKSRNGQSIARPTDVAKGRTC